MAFDADESEWSQFLSAWPLDRLRKMSLEEYASAGSKDCFIHWLEFRLGGLGSIAGGSAFKFGIFARGNSTPKTSQSDLAYDDKYGWYKKFGSTPQEAFEKVRGHVVEVAEAAAAGRLEAIDHSPLGAVYRWKIAFLYQSRQDPRIACVFLAKPLRAFLGLPPTDSREQSALYRELSEKKNAGEGIVAFSERLWKDWVFSNPYRVTLKDGAIQNGNLQLNLISAPFPESMYGDASGETPGELARFVTDTGDIFESDIRVPGPGGSGRIRHRFGAYYKAVGAKEGDVIVITPQDDGSYRISHASNGKGAAPASSMPAPAAKPLALASKPMAPMASNLILFGPPGTGKTYATIDKALEILDPELVEQTEEDDDTGRTRRKARFDALVKDRRVRFVTFHQSFSYEDFVEGLRAETENGRLQYRVVPGIFREICEDARGASKLATSVGAREGARIWKISIDGTGSSPTRDYCLAHGEARIGWGHLGDLLNESLEDSDGFQALGKNDRKSVREFSRVIQKGDVLACIRSNSEIQAVGVVTGDYRFEASPPAAVYEDFRHVLPVRWLATGFNLDIRSLNDGAGLTLRTVYPLRRMRWPQLVEALGEQGIALVGESEMPEIPGHAVEDYVLIIDEINRGNVARIFGELITLIEASKRDGHPERLEVQLPYSKDRFSVPSNVHIIGTMNTADRSLTGLDVALRRRFDFVPMPPRPELLTLPLIEGVDVRRMLEVMNQRIEVLLGRDHQLGHAYFMALQPSKGVAGLAQIFRNKIVPLLQEYFFEDWQRIAWVLNDHRKPDACSFIVQSDHNPTRLFGKDVDMPPDTRLWQVNPGAFNNIESYRRITDESLE
jgi:5-methylcytosine-specific restriction enzyme B